MNTVRALCVIAYALACANAQIPRITADNIQQGLLNAIVDAGGDDDYVGCSTVPITAYGNGLIISVKPSTPNTGAATVNVCGLGVRNIKASSGSNPADGAVVAGHANLMVDNGTEFRLVDNGGVATITSAGLDAVLAPGADACINPTVNGAAEELIFDPACLASLAWTWTGLHVWTPSTTQAITGVSGTISANANVVQVDPNGTYTLTSTPTIANGSNGQETTICNIDTTLTLTLQDEANLSGSNLRNGGSNISLAPLTCRKATYTTALGDWSFLSAGASSAPSAVNGVGVGGLWPFGFPDYFVNGTAIGSTNQEFYTFDTGGATYSVNRLLFELSIAATSNCAGAASTCGLSWALYNASTGARVGITTTLTSGTINSAGPKKASFTGTITLSPNVTYMLGVRSDSADMLIYAKGTGIGTSIGNAGTALQYGTNASGTGDGATVTLPATVPTLSAWSPIYHNTPQVKLILE